MSPRRGFRYLTALIGDGHYELVVIDRHRNRQWSFAFCVSSHEISHCLAGDPRALWMGRAVLELWAAVYEESPDTLVEADALGWVNALEVRAHVLRGRRVPMAHTHPWLLFKVQLLRLVGPSSFHVTPPSPAERVEGFLREQAELAKKWHVKAPADARPANPTDIDGRAMAIDTIAWILGYELGWTLDHVRNEFGDETANGLQALLGADMAEWEEGLRRRAEARGTTRAQALDDAPKGATSPDVSRK